MKKIMLKLIFWLIVLGILCLAGYQNISFFMSKYAFEINYYFGKHIFPEVYTGLYVAGFFMAGFIISSFFTIGFRFRTSRTIKTLKKEISVCDRYIASLKEKLASQTRSLPGDSHDTGQTGSET